MPGVASYFLGQYLGNFIGPPWLVSVGLLFLFYPIVLLSSLEANSPFVPVTLPILKSLANVAWAWAVFYGLSLCLAIVSVAPLVWGFGLGTGAQFLGMIVLAPIMAGSCFLYARLLGRLAWRASLEVQTDEEDEETKDEKAKKSKPKGKKKLKVSGSSGELQAVR